MAQFLAFLLGCVIAALVRKARTYRAADPRIFAVSRQFNALTGGDIDETFCARTGRKVILGEHPQPIWLAAQCVCNWAFCLKEPDHCFRSLLRHIEGK